MKNPVRVVAVLATLLPACVGPDIDYGEVRTFEVEQLAPGPYIIAAGDTLNIQFTYHPERSTTVIVRPDGRFSMPLAEEVEAAGLTIAELDAKLTALVDQHLRDADLTVVPMAQAQERVFVAGEVARPGDHRLIPGMTLHQALTAAGWMTQTAAPDSVIVIRQLEPGKRAAYKVDCSEDALIAFDTELQRFDIVYVPQSSIARVGEWVDNYLNRTTPRWAQAIGQVWAIRETDDR